MFAIGRLLLMATNNQTGSLLTTFSSFPPPRSRLSPLAHRPSPFLLPPSSLVALPHGVGLRGWGSWVGPRQGWIRRGRPYLHLPLHCLDHLLGDLDLYHLSPRPKKRKKG